MTLRPPRQPKGTIATTHTGFHKTVGPSKNTDDEQARAVKYLAGRARDSDDFVELARTLGLDNAILAMAAQRND